MSTISITTTTTSVGPIQRDLSPAHCLSPGPSHRAENQQEELQEQEEGQGEEEEEEEQDDEEEEEDGRRKRRRSDSYSLTFDGSLSWCVIGGLGSGGRDRHNSQSSDSTVRHTYTLDVISLCCR